MLLYIYIRIEASLQEPTGLLYLQLKQLYIFLVSTISTVIQVSFVVKHKWYLLTNIYRH